MTTQLMRHTQVMVNLSLNIVTRNDNHEQLITWNLVRLTGFIFWLLSMRQVTAGIGYELHQAIGDLAESALTFCEAFYVGISIILNSVAFGLGVSS